MNTRDMDEALGVLIRRMGQMIAGRDVPGATPQGIADAAIEFARAAGMTRPEPLHSEPLVQAMAVWLEFHHDDGCMAIIGASHACTCTQRPLWADGTLDRAIDAARRPDSYVEYVAYMEKFARTWKPPAPGTCPACGKPEAQHVQMPGKITCPPETEIP